MDRNDHVRQSIYNLTPIKAKEQCFIAVLHFTVTVGSSTMIITRTLK